MVCGIVYTKTNKVSIMTASGKIYDMSNKKPFKHAEKMHPTALSIFLNTVLDVLVFLGASIGFIVQVSLAGGRHFLLFYIYI